MHRYAAILIFTTTAFGQAVRFDSSIFTTNPTCVTGKQCPVLAVPGATISVSTDAAGTTPATTYTSSTAGTSCGSLGQLTPPSGGPCTSVTDSLGNFGFWVTAGSYWYKAYFPGGASLGPYPISAGNVAGSIVCGSSTQIQYNNGGNCGASSGLTYNGTSLSLTGILNATAGCSGCFVLPQSFAQSTSGPMLTLTQTGSGSAMALTGGLAVDTVAASGAISSGASIAAGTSFRIAGHSFIDAGGYRGAVGTGYVIDGSNNGLLNSLQLTNQTSASTGSAGSLLLSATTAGVYASVNGAAPILLGSGGGGGSVTWPATGTVLISAGTSSNPTGLAPVNGNCLVGASGAWSVGSCSGSGTAVTSVTGTGILNNSASTGNVTLAWAGTSGGIPYFSGATATASSAALGSTQVVLGGGAGAAPNSSAQFTFSGTQVGATSTGDSSYSATGGAFGNAYLHLVPGSGGSAWDVKAQGTSVNLTLDYGGATKLTLSNTGQVNAAGGIYSAYYIGMTNQGAAVTGGASNGIVSSTSAGIYGSVSGGSPILMTNTYAAALNQSLTTGASPTFVNLTVTGCTGCGSGGSYTAGTNINIAGSVISTVASPTFTTLTATSAVTTQYLTSTLGFNVNSGAATLNSSGALVVTSCTGCGGFALPYVGSTALAGNAFDVTNTQSSTSARAINGYAYYGTGAYFLTAGSAVSPGGFTDCLGGCGAEIVYNAGHSSGVRGKALYVHSDSSTKGYALEVDSAYGSLAAAYISNNGGGISAAFIGGLNMNGVNGLTRVLNLMNSGGSACTLTLDGGVPTATTC